ncbi:hypothetical protein L202_04136 [Cryptococcus amylolentus CBS 6039]|uniref:Uncharacterized protein n=1 Tax=Cryptococcus amylolentus CBS 6039 TaxID=1295533 RepID=A0A1E3HQ74_9TREE|nr:hypothetical protein L202_04136 [Cryptococcus amylolentus CBS 6039]ODN78509.1 hypothetical protein L202_04136 [Cryptococcus amylolentus CBS 6039]
MSTARPMITSPYQAQAQPMFSKRPLYTPRPPPGFKRKVWDIKTRFDVTFALSVMSPTEQLIVWSILILCATSILYYIFGNATVQLLYATTRWTYYVYGDEAAHPIIHGISRNVSARVWQLGQGSKAGRAPAAFAALSMGGKVVP